MDAIFARKLITLVTKGFCYSFSIANLTGDLLTQSFLVFEVHGLQAV